MFASDCSDASCETQLGSEIRLGDMRRHERGRIIRLEGSEAMLSRLCRMGFVEGAHVEILHEAPWGKDPIAVEVRGALIALRRDEARGIFVRKAETA